MTQQTQTQDKEKPKPLTIDQYLRSDILAKQVRDALPDGMSPVRFLQSAFTSVMRNRKLLECTRDSLFKCLMDLTQMGLEPDGRRAHLIPFKHTKTGVMLCTVIIDYKGIAELIRRNGDVAHIHCDVVGDNDQFICRYGSGGKLEHIPHIVDRGKIYAVYSYIRLKSGDEEFDVMSKGEVEMIRAMSRGKDEKPWTEHWNEMAKKTVLRRHSKMMVLSPLTRAALEYGEDEELGLKGAVAAVVPKFTPALPAESDFINLGEFPQAEPEPEPVPEPAPEPTRAAPAAQQPKAAPRQTKPPDSRPELESKASAPRPAPPAKKQSSTAVQAPSKELFGDEPETESDADKLIVQLHQDGIKWEHFCGWIASTGALGQNVVLPIAITELKAELLADCVQNYQANIEEYARWKESLQG